MHVLTFREAIKEAIVEEMEKDPLVFLMGENVAIRGGVYQVTHGLCEKFGEERILDMPISESGFVGAGVGAAILGMRPIVDLMFSDFLPLVVDHIVNDAAKTRYMYGGKASAPMVVRAFFGAGTSLGASHSQSLEAWLVHCPGLKVVMPSTPADAKGLLKTAIRDDDPIVFLEHRLLYATRGEVPEDKEFTIPLGKADIKRKGDHVTVVATASMVGKSLEAAEALARDGIEIEVLDPRSLQPLDVDTLIESVEKTGRLLIAHEACMSCGFGAEISAIAAKKAFGYLDAPIERVCAPDVPVPFSPPLENYYIPKSEDIVATVRKMIS